MKFIKYILLSLFVFSCSEDDPVSSSVTCNSDLVGTWLQTAMGNYTDSNDCTVATTPPTEAPSNPTTSVLAGDCTYTVTGCDDCSDAGDAEAIAECESACTGTWYDSGTDIVIFSTYYQTLLENAPADLVADWVAMYTYTPNLDNTVVFKNTQGDDGLGNLIYCQYEEYTKQ